MKFLNPTFPQTPLFIESFGEALDSNLEEVVETFKKFGNSSRLVFFLNIEDQSSGEMLVDLINRDAIGFELFKFSDKPCDWQAIISGIGWCFWELTDPTEDAHWILTKVRNSPVDDILVFFWDGFNLFHS